MLLTRLLCRPGFSFTVGAVTTDIQGPRGPRRSSMSGQHLDHTALHPSILQGSGLSGFHRCVFGSTDCSAAVFGHQKHDS